MLPAGELLNMLNFFGWFGPWPRSSGNPQKFNMFNMSAVWLTFFSRKHTEFSISHVEIIFDSRRGNVNFVAGVSGSTRYVPISYSL